MRTLSATNTTTPAPLNNSKSSVIPKIIHYCWFGGGEMDEKSRAYIAAWKKILPDYDIKEWTDKDLPLLAHNRYVTEAYQAKKYAFVSDVFRLYALYTMGGIYLDTDVEVRRSFDPFLSHDFFIGSEKCGSAQTIGTAVIGAKKGCDLIQKMLALYNQLPFLLKNGKYDTTPNTVRLVSVLNEFGIKNVYTDSDPIQIQDGAVIYPVSYFSMDHETSYAVHHFAGSWCDPWKCQLRLTLPLTRTKRLVWSRFKKRTNDVAFSYPPHTQTVLFEKETKKGKKILLTLESADLFVNPRLGRFYHIVGKAFSKYPTPIKRLISLTLKNTKQTFKYLFNRPNFGVSDSIIRTAFYLNGGIGDIVIALNYIQHFITAFENRVCVTVLPPRHFVDETRRLLQNKPNIIVQTQKNPPLQQDVIFSLVRLPVVEFAERRKLRAVSPKLATYIDHLITFLHTHPEMNTPGTVMDKLAELYTKLQHRHRVTQGDIDNLLGVTDSFHIDMTDTGTLKREIPLPNPYITIHLGCGHADGQHMTRSTRLCSPTVFDGILARLKTAYPDYTIVQIGEAVCTPLKGVDLNLCGQTTFDELLSVLNKASLHIDCEGGLVHLRHFMDRKPSVVLFGPTDETFFGYPENINISGRSCSVPCEWLHTKWRQVCLMNQSNECMTRFNSDDIINTINNSGILTHVR